MPERGGRVPADLQHHGRDGAHRAGRAPLRLAAAATAREGRDLGYLPGVLAADSAHVPPLRASHAHAAGRDPRQQGGLHFNLSRVLDPRMPANFPYLSKASWLRSGQEQQQGSAPANILLEVVLDF